MLNSKKITGIITSLIVIIIACKNMDVEKRKWLPSSSGDNMYPMSILASTIELEDGRQLYIAASGISSNGWGYLGPIHEQGDDLKAMPIKFSLLWGSLLERKYYKGEWELPKDTILKHIDKGYHLWRTNDWETYHQLNFGVAPGGIVVVWLKGFDNQIEIGRYQAQETTVDIKSYIPGNENMTDDLFFDVSISNPEAYELFKEKGIPFGLWDKYRIKKTWKPEIDIDNHKLEYIGLRYSNGEEKTYAYHELDSVLFELRPSIKMLTIGFKTGKKKKQVVRFDFDRDEMLSLFDQLNSNEKSVLKVEGEDLKDGKIYFQQGDKKLFIKKIDWENQWNLDR